MAWMQYGHYADDLTKNGERATLGAALRDFRSISEAGQLAKPRIQND